MSTDTDPATALASAPRRDKLRLGDVLAQQGLVTQDWERTTRQALGNLDPQEPRRVITVGPATKAAVAPAVPALAVPATPVAAVTTVPAAPAAAAPASPDKSGRPAATKATVAKPPSRAGVRRDKAKRVTQRQRKTRLAGKPAAPLAAPPAAAAVAPPSTLAAQPTVTLMARLWPMRW